MSCSGCVHSRLIANIVAISRRGSRGLFWIGVRKQPCNRGLDLRSTRPYASITRQSVANDLDVRSATDLASSISIRDFLAERNRVLLTVHDGARLILSPLNNIFIFAICVDLLSGRVKRPFIDEGDRACVSLEK